MFGIRIKTKKRTVLFLINDEKTLHLIEKGLLNKSYNKLFAKNSKEALEFTQHEEVHVIVADMCLPNMTGLEFLRTIRKEFPEIIGIILTGYGEDNELQEAVERGEILKFVPKPWKFGLVDLESLISQAIKDFNLRFSKLPG